MTEISERLVDAENRAGIVDAICGWKQPHVALEWARRYWRDVHSPAIARRDGIYDYRQLQFDPVRTDLLAPIPGIDYACPADQQLMWLSDIRYLDEEALARFAASPAPEVKAHLLSDISRIVDKTTTYRIDGSNARTLIDETDRPASSGPAANPTFNLFLRARSDVKSFRSAVRGLARGWAENSAALRVRVSLFETPGAQTRLPINAHPPEMRYQAWIELVLRHGSDTANLPASVELGKHVSHIHAHPTPLVYSFVYRGRPTLVGLRGYPAYEAINAIGASGQTEDRVLRWMYGGVVPDDPKHDAGGHISHVYDS